jgi:hypothetical protein
MKILYGRHFNKSVWIIDGKIITTIKSEDEVARISHHIARKIN